MVKNLDEVMEKIKKIKEETDVVEFRVLNTRTHIETVEETVKKVNKEILEGFHAISLKINTLNEHMNKLDSEIQELITLEKSKK